MSKLKLIGALAAVAVGTVAAIFVDDFHGRLNRKIDDANKMLDIATSLLKVRKEQLAQARQDLVLRDQHHANELAKLAGTIANHQAASTALREAEEQVQITDFSQAEYVWLVAQICDDFVNDPFAKNDEAMPTGVRGLDTIIESAIEDLPKVKIITLFQASPRYFKADESFQDYFEFAFEGLINNIATEIEETNWFKQKVQALSDEYQEVFTEARAVQEAIDAEAAEGPFDDALPGPQIKTDPFIVEVKEELQPQRANAA